MNDADDADVLAAAVAFEEIEIVRSAIASGVDVNRVGSNGTPLLVLAAAKGTEAIVRLLLDSGADPDQPDQRRGMTALHAAASRGSTDVARELLASGASVNRTFGWPPMTALAVAFRRGYKGLVRLLLDSGADPNASINLPDDPQEQLQLTPLIFAASAGDVEMCRLLIDHGANLDAAKADGMTPLMAATFNGWLEAVRYLTDAGANLNLVNNYDPYKPFSALDLAVIGRQPEIAAYLKSCGAVSAGAVSA